MPDLSVEINGRGLPESVTRLKKKPEYSQPRDEVIVHPEFQKPIPESKKAPPESFDPQKMARGLIEGAVYPIQPAPNELGAKFNPADPEGYKVQVGPTGLKFNHPETGEEMAKMPFRSTDFDSNKKYGTRADGPYDVLIDPETKREVARVRRIAGGSGVPDFPLGWDGDRLREHMLEQVDFYEKHLNLLTADIINDYGTKIANYTFGGTITPEQRRQIRDEVQKEVNARLFLAAADYYLTTGAADKFAEMMGNYWKNELLRKIYETEGVKEAVAAMEIDDGAYFRPRDPRSKNKDEMSNDLLPSVGGDLEKAKLAVDLAARLFNITGISSYYGGPVDAHGGLIEKQIADRVFGGRMVNMKDDRYWNEWDLQRRKGIMVIPGSPNGHKIPFALKANIYTPELLEEGQIGLANSLRRVCETRVRSLAYFKGVRTMTDLIDIIQPTGNSNPSFLGDGDWRVWAGMLKGASELVAKLDKDPPRLLSSPMISANKAREDPEKFMAEILKPYFETAAAYGYLTNYTYGSPGSAAEEPFKARAYLLGQLLRYVGTKEGQNLLGLVRGKTWGEQEILAAINTAETARALDAKMANTLKKGFGVSALRIRAGKITTESGKQAGGGLWDILKIITGMR